ncbi:MAG: hypothetical protein Q9225_005164 [Loekoesia sp. 1 TL-2023]
MQPRNNSLTTVEADLFRYPIATPHWGAQGGSAFTVRAVASINATPSVVLQHLLDTANYPAWNNFVPRVTLLSTPDSSNSSAECQLQEGVLFTEHVDMYGHGKPSGFVKVKLLMTTLEETEDSGRKNYKVVWLGKAYPDWALRSERVHVIRCDDNGNSTYDVWETFSGPLALLVRLCVGKTLVERFRQWNQELKSHSEQVG